MLGELLLEGAVRASTEKGTTYVDAVRAPEVEDELLQFAYDLVAAESHRWTASDWVTDSQAARRRGPCRPRASCARASCAVRRRRYCGSSIGALYPEVDPEPERRILARMREAVFDSDAPLDARTTVLVAVAHRTGLLEANFDKKQLRRRKARIEEIVAGNCIGEAAKEVSDATSAAINTVIFAGAILPSIIS